MHWIDPTLKDWLGDADPFAKLAATEGRTYRLVRGRRTFRIAIDGRGYFVKWHSGLGWREIITKLLRCERPVTDARNEWRAAERLRALGIDTVEVVGFGLRGVNPARYQSFVITKELADAVSLEDYCRHWRSRPPAPGLKWRILRRIAEISAALHAQGIYHRDLYLCHFHLHVATVSEATPKLSLIDLHRVPLRLARRQHRARKDLVRLLYSVMDLGLRERDLLRFARHYDGGDLRLSLTGRTRFWRAIRRQATKLRRRLGQAFDTGDVARCQDSA